jgi:hypothetical protein
MPEQYWGHPVTPAEEAVRLRRAQAGDNPACLPGLAAALTDLGGCYGGVGRHQDAIAPSRKPSGSTAPSPATTPPTSPASPPR